MKKILKRFLFACFMLTGLMFPALAQKTAIYNNPDAEFRYAQELFNKEKYGAAQQKFLHLVRTIKDNSCELSAQSEYYAAMCAIELFNGDAGYLVVQYIRDHPEHTRVYSAWLQLARYQFRNKKYKNAIMAFEKVDKEKLNDEENNEYNFKYGYCCFMANDFEKAKNSFYEVKDKDSKYAAGATYYFAHIAYNEKNYETALKSFKKLKNDEVYGKFVPYYITHIYYLQGKYDELLAIAPALLDSATSKRAPEIARMIGEAYYRTQRPEKAIPYLQMYMDKNPGTLTRGDYYEMGYCYFKTDDPGKAIEWLGKVNTDINDSLSQIASYNLADCYIKTDKKQTALSYFKMASTMDFDKDIKEDALFNYAKLAYETSYNPFNEAINAFQFYIKEYPSSPRLDEAYGYLSSLYLSTKNYKDALTTLENIKKRDVSLNKIYQKVSYFRAIQMFNDTAYGKTNELLSKSLLYPLDQRIAALALYWRGETWYRLEDWDSARINYQKFMNSTGALRSGVFNTANYNIGYCWFKQKDYKSALTFFRKFLTNTGTENRSIVNDAYLRTGDCFFMTKDFNSAIENYDKSIEMKLVDNDYAMFQKALAYGPLGKFENKAQVLIELTDKYPKSVYADDAILETAETFKNLGNNDKAITYYDKLVSSKANSSFISKGYLGKGIIYYNSKQDEQAFQSLIYVVENYRGTSESREALQLLSNVCVSLNRVDDYIKIVNSSGGSVTDIKKDSLAYFAVESRMGSDCPGAISGFKEYLSRYPNGQFTIDASFYKAECEYMQQNFTDALPDYVYVIGKPSTKYLETSLYKAAEISFGQKNYADALGFYNRLEDIAGYKNNITVARTGRMRCDYNLSRYDDAINASRKLLTTEKLSSELTEEAHLTIGRSALAVDSVSTAVAEFTVLSRMSKDEMGAEAKWNLGYIQYVLGNYEESNKLAFDLINQVPSYDYWVAKAFILLADNYFKMGNNRQAKSTLQSVIDHYEGADLIKLAQDKLNNIIAAEKQEEQRKQDEQLKQQQLQSPGDTIVPKVESTQDEVKPEQH